MAGLGVEKISKNTYANSRTAIESNSNHSTSPATENHFSLIGFLAPKYAANSCGARHKLYLLNEYDGSLYNYSYDAQSGALSEIQVSSTVPPDFDKERIVRAADIHLTPRQNGGEACRIQH